jgi:hypothetical protein
MLGWGGFLWESQKKTQLFHQENMHFPWRVKKLITDRPLKNIHAGAFYRFLVLSAELALILGSLRERQKI